MHRCHNSASGAARLVRTYRWQAARLLISLRIALRLRYAYALACSLLLMCAADAALGANQDHQQEMQATTSDAARREAIKAIPLKKIQPLQRQAVMAVLNDCSLYRRMPTKAVDCDPKLFTFLAQNPEMLVEMWQQLGISHVSLERTGANTFSLADGAGTTGELVIVELKCDDRAQNRIVMYAEGAYDGKPFKKPVRAQCVLLLRSGSMTETNGRDYVACRMDSFVRIERTSIELFAKAMHPWVGKTADTNFVDTIGFISSLSQAAEQRPATIERLITGLPRVSSERQQQMVEIAYDCSEKYTTDETPRLARKPQ